MMNQNKEKLIAELFESNDFKDMFDMAAQKQWQIQENTLLLNRFYSLLNLETLKELAQRNKMGEFLDELVSFLQKDQNFNKNEKKKFLNGCENILFLHALMLGKEDCASYLDQYRLDKSLYLNRNFLLNRITEKNYEVVEKLLDYSETVTYESSKVLKLLYVSLCRDYELIKRLIAKYDFDINAHGELGLADSFRGSFIHVLALMSDPESNIFFADFLRDYGSKINFDVEFNDTERQTQINVLDLIIHNESLKTTEKMFRLTTILTYGSLSEKNISHLSKILITEAIMSRFYNDPIYDSLFAHHSFNSSEFNREAILNQLLKLDNSEAFKKVRSESNNTINPTSIMLDKFFRFSSPINSTETHPLVLWVEANADNPGFPVDTLSSLIRHFKSEVTEIGLADLKIPAKMAQMLNNAGISITKKKGMFSKIFKKEKAAKEKTTTDFDTKVEPVIDTPISSTNTEEVVMFNHPLFSEINDDEVSQQVYSITLQASQYLEIETEDADAIYLQTKLPKLLNTTVENYLKFMGNDPKVAKKNALIQLKLLNKKTFEILENALKED